MNDASCQLCFQEPADKALTIVGIRLGPRCHARALAIAAESGVAVAAALERHVYRASVHGIVCVTCGAELEVDEQHLAIMCPNGHAVELRTARADPATRPRVCERCSNPIERKPGQLGRPEKIHDACLTPAERATRTAARDNMRARAKAGRT